jgi:GH35 family endo-1,4-beta-xylanase
MPRLVAAIILTIAMFTSAAAAAAAEKPLPPGVAVMPPEGLTVFGLMGEGAVTRQPVAVQGQAFQTAVRCVTVRPANEPWGYQLVGKSAAPVAKGDVLLGTFWARCIEPAGGQARTAFIFEVARSPWAKSAEFPVTVGPEWTKINVPFRAAQDYAAGEAHINLHLGMGPQTIEIGGLAVTNFGRAVALKDLPRTSFAYDGSAPDAPWRAAAAERIEKIRKGDLAVTVTDAAGRPVAGAEVRVAMKRHAFGFGSAVVARRIMGDGPDHARYREIIEQNFSRVVFENDLKWPGWENRPGREITMKALDWLEARSIEVRGHCLVWPSWQNTPRGLRDLKDKPDALREAVAAHVREEAAALKGRIAEWDVVNEPYTNHDIMDVLGMGVMADWFRIAREADPAPILYLNDYSILTGGGRDVRHQADFEKHLKALIEAGAPLGGVGMQGHFGGDLTGLPRVLEILDRFAALGRPISITEFDIDTLDEEQQARYTRDFMTAVFSHPSARGILTWGFWEGSHWRPAAALWRRDWTIKPNGEAWLDLVKRQWWTDATARSDASGRAAVRGFLGAYEVTVTAGAATRTVAVTLSKEGAKVTVALP